MDAMELAILCLLKSLIGGKRIMKEVEKKFCPDCKKRELKKFHGKWWLRCIPCKTIWESKKARERYWKRKKENAVLAEKLKIQHEY